MASARSAWGNKSFCFQALIRKVDHEHPFLGDPRRSLQTTDCGINNKIIQHLKLFNNPFVPSGKLSTVCAIMLVIFATQLKDHSCPAQQFVAASGPMLENKFWTFTTLALSLHAILTLALEWSFSLSSSPFWLESATVSSWPRLSSRCQLHFVST